jgi:hypothetical protein
MGIRECLTSDCLARTGGLVPFRPRSKTAVDGRLANVINPPIILSSLLLGSHQDQWVHVVVYAECCS